MLKVDMLKDMAIIPAIKVLLAIFEISARNLSYREPLLSKEYRTAPQLRLAILSSLDALQ